MKRFIFSLLSILFATNLVAMQDDGSRKRPAHEQNDQRPTKKTFAHDPKKEFYQAIAEGNFEHVKQLIPYCSFINDANRMFTPLHTTILHKIEAAKNPALSHKLDEFDKIVELLLQSGAHVNRTIIAGNQTELTLAVPHSYNEKLVQLLLQAGAEPNVFTSDAKTPLHLAIEADNPDKNPCEQIVFLLLAYNADPNFYVPTNLLLLAASKNKLKIAKLLLAHGAEVESVNFASLSLSNASLQAIDLLLEYGANPSTAFFDGRFWLNSFTQAIVASSLERFELFLQHGVDPNYKANVQAKPYIQWLQEHIGEDAIEAMRILFIYGAKFDSDAQYETFKRLLEKNLDPLCFAAAFGTLENLQSLFNRCTNTAIRESALMWACLQGKEDHINYMLSQGVSPKRALKQVTALLMNSKDETTPYMQIFRKLADSLPATEEPQRFLGELFTRTIKMRKPHLTQLFLSQQCDVEPALHYLDCYLSRTNHYELKDRHYFIALKTQLTRRAPLTEQIMRGSRYSDTLFEGLSQLNSEFREVVLQRMSTQRRIAKQEAKIRAIIGSNRPSNI